MKKTVFKGSATAIVTPMYPDGSVNFEKFRELLDYQINYGTDAVVVCGTTGESATLNTEEHVKTIECAVQHVNGRIPVIAGTGSNDTAYGIELSKEAESLGADALLMVTPYYNKTSQSGLIRHFNAMADAVSVPVILYNVPSRTGCNILPKTCLELSKHENIVTIKEACGNISQIAETMALCGEELPVYSGNDDQTVPIMSLGGIGVISVFANILPKTMHDIAASCLGGDFKTASALHLKYLDLMNALFCDVNPIPVKAAMNMLGLEVGEPRLPLDLLNESNSKFLEGILSKHGIL